ncbi:MAG: ATP-binding cassette domain-containing protein, partial [Acidobacteriota bacterium]|nr:ATP-binding cassette domain-containing protein [Acidobacteriota bacterium]
MALLLNTQGLAKSYGAAFLFRNVSLSIQEGDRVGLIGPNGSGKSTLLEILAERREADSGDVSVRKGTRLAYLPQESQFPPGETVREVIRRALKSG